jgi:hypothetical protein
VLVGVLILVVPGAGIYVLRCSVVMQPLLWRREKHIQIKPQAIIYAVDYSQAAMLHHLPLNAPLSFALATACGFEAEDGACER